MEIEIRAEAKMEPKDYISLTRFLSYEKSRFSPLINTVLIVAVLLGLYADFMINHEFGLLTVVAILAVVFTYGLPEFTARRFVRTDKSFIGHEFKYLFNEKGINLLDETAGTTALFAWPTILNLYEMKDHFFVFLSKQNALVIPKRSFSAEDLSDLRELVSYQIGKRFEPRWAPKKKKEKKAKNQ